jgi:hypothetical protein
MFQIKEKEKQRNNTNVISENSTSDIRSLNEISLRRYSLFATVLLANCKKTPSDITLPSPSKDIVFIKFTLPFFRLIGHLINAVETASLNNHKLNTVYSYN